MYKVNIVIPSITTDSRLIRCLDGVQNLNYKNFFVTLVLDDNKNLSKLKKFKFKIKILFLKRANMSTKRNIVAKKFNSVFLAFIDSDAYPSKNWLINAINEMKSKKIEIIGGPNIPFENENFWQRISYYCKRSFFVTAQYNFINYKSYNRYCNLLHSSNFIISKKLYMSVNGMNKNLFIGEDHDFFYRLNEKFKNLKVYFAKKVFVYHEDREFKFFLMQRFCYGLNVLTAKNTKIKRILALIPFFSICIVFLLLLNLSKLSLIVLSSFFVLLSFIIFLETKKYINEFRTTIVVIICIYLSNLFYGFGTIIYFFGVRNRIEKKIYRNIKKKLNN